jgi:hypothetical protein
MQVICILSFSNKNWFIVYKWVLKSINIELLKNADV